VLLGTLARAITIGSASITASFPGPVSAAAVSAGSLRTDSMTVAGPVSVSSLGSAGSLTVRGSALLSNIVQLSGDSAFTIARSAHSGSAGQPTLLAGQAAGHASCLGGDLVLEAGTGVLAGTVRVGGTSDAVRLGQSGKTVTVLGSLSATGATLSGSLTALSLSSGAATVTSLAVNGITTGPLSATVFSVGVMSASGSVTADALSTASAITVGGSLQLGADTLYTIGRRTASAARGRTTLLRGQIGASGSTGGDLALEAGSGTTAGTVIVCAPSECVRVVLTNHRSAPLPNPSCLAVQPRPWLLRARCRHYLRPLAV
jgi:hypothetical protein